MAYADMDIFSLKTIDCHIIFVTIYVRKTVVSQSVIRFFLWGEGWGDLFNIFSLKGLLIRAPDAKCILMSGTNRYATMAFVDFKYTFKLIIHFDLEC